MQAYNKKDLYNNYVQQQATEALHANCIGVETHKNIVAAYPGKLYTPNYFIRIALGLLTVVAALFAGFLIGLLFGESLGFTRLFIFFALLYYAFLELLVKQKQYYNAGVDNVLMLACITNILIAFFVDDFDVSYVLVTGVIMISCLWFCIRFVDAFMASVFYLCFFAFIFLVYIKLGTIAKVTAPIVMLIVSVIAYVAANKLHKKKSLLFYQFCCKAIMLLALITAYASVNYFAVRELSNKMFDLQGEVPFGWLLWILSFIIPVAYIFYGIRKKDFLFIRTGLALVAATIFTIRYYYALLPLEYAMLIGGVIITAISYALIRYLRTPKYGYSFEKNNRISKEILNAEALIIAQTFGAKTETAKTEFEFGGGGSGGGGSTGSY